LENRQTLSADALDLTFGVSGKTVMTFNESGEEVRDSGVTVAVDKAGLIVIAGSTDDGDDTSFAVSRLKSDGTPDSSFGTNGRCVLPLPSTDAMQDPYGTAFSVSFDSQGRILVAGSINDLNDDEEFIRMFAVTRITVDGQQDTSYGDNGWAIVGFGLEGQQDFLVAACLDVKGRLVLAGYTDRGDGDYDFAVARLTPTGTLDVSFSGDGRAVFDFNVGGSNSDRAFAVTVDKAGRVLVAGSVAVSEGDTDFGVVRLNEDGTLDRRFDKDGRVTVAFNRLPGRKGVDDAFDVAVDKAGRILVAGRIQASPGDVDFAVVRLNQSGQLTRDFGSKGRVVVPFNLGGENYDGGWLVRNDYETRLVGRVQLAIDSKSRIVVSGPVQTGQDDYDYGVFRLTTSGKLDKTFGLNSRVVVAFNQAGAGVDQPLDVTRDRQDRVILVGSVQSTPADDEGLWRSRVGVTRLTVNGRRPRPANARA
jgi:uncharacterized delta-60 repeat protein